MIGSPKNQERFVEMMLQDKNVSELNYLGKGYDARLLYMEKAPIREPFRFILFRFDITLRVFGLFVL